MKLVVIITGLVLLAPDRDHGRLHLFLPQMDMGHPKAERHAPYLEYTSALGARNEPLAGWTLDLGTLARPGSAIALPDQIISLDGMYADIPRDWVTGAPSRRVQGRVSLPWPERFKVRESARWHLTRGIPIRYVRLTNEVVLEYDSARAERWVLASLPWGPGGTKALPAMQAEGETDTIRISNMPPDGGAPVGRRDEGVHFQGYVDILRRSAIDHVWWRPRVYLADGPFGISPYNCMLASAPIG